MRVLRNTIALYASFGGNLVFSFVQLKILSAYLPKDPLGLLFALQGIALIVAEASKLGFPLTFARYLPKFEAELDSDKARGLLALGIGAHLALGLLELLLAFLVFHLFGLRSDLVRLFPLAFVSYFLYANFGLIFSAFVGRRRMVRGAVLNVGFLLAFNLTLFLRRDVLDVPGVLWVQLLTVIPFFFLSILLLDLFPLRPRGVFREIRGFWKFSAYTSLLAPVFHYVDRIIVTAFLPLASVAVFTVGRKIDRALKNLLAIPMTSFGPEVSFAAERGRTRMLREGATLFARLNVLAALATFLLVILLGKLAIRVVSTEAYLGAYPVLVILASSLVPTGISAPIGMYARSIGNMKLFFSTNLMWIVVYLGTSIALVRPLGLNGVALATLIASTIVAFYSYAFVGRWIGISLIPRRTLALYVALWVAGGILTYLFRPSGIAFLVLTVLVGYLGLSREEKGLLRTYLRFRGRTPGGLMEP
jgi:O-antigen/teichoic acid export membrane protein